MGLFREATQTSHTSALIPTTTVAPFRAWRGLRRVNARGPVRVTIESLPEELTARALSGLSPAFARLCQSVAKPLAGAYHPHQSVSLPRLAMLLFVDKLTNSDFSYLHPERGLLGETWLSHIELEGALDEQGMVCDFGIVKKTVRRLLDDLIDHRLLVPAHAPNIKIDEGKDMTSIVWQLNSGSRIEHSSPNQCITLLDTDVVTPESVAQWCEQLVRLELPQLIDSVKLGFSVEAINGAYYHYSHGLKKHEGKCQRIAHGHRSRIEIEKDGNRDPALEQQWAQRFTDIYIGTQEDVNAISGDAGYTHFNYQAPEGDFNLLLPKKSCYLINSDSTVECIAQHIADTLKEQSPKHQFKVKAFEGLDKGAVVSR